MPLKIRTHYWKTSVTQRASTVRPQKDLTILALLPLAYHFVFSPRPYHINSHPHTQDVAFGNWRGDYGGFLRLMNPQDTLGWWRLGSEQDMWGRYARGFADATDPESAFQLTLDHGLWEGLPLSTPKKLALRVLFFDQGKGRFEVRYDGLGSDALTLITVTKTNTSQWKEACAEVTDGRFGGRGPGNSDIWIRNADTEDDILGAVEIADVSLDDIALKGCDYASL